MDMKRGLRKAVPFLFGTRFPYCFGLDGFDSEGRPICSGNRFGLLLSSAASYLSAEVQGVFIGEIISHADRLSL